jgi:hypothetical protein
MRLSQENHNLQAKLLVNAKIKPGTRGSERSYCAYCKERVQTGVVYDYMVFCDINCVVNELMEFIEIIQKKKEKS